MNKVYKVIWSNAKNCYVVVSELAKSRVKAVNLCKTLVAVSILTAVVSDSGILARAYAEEKEAISVEEEFIDNSERYVSEEDIIDEEKINKTMALKAAGDKKPGTTVKYDEIITGEVHKGHESGRYGDIAIGENSSVNRVMQDPNGTGNWGEDASAAGVAVGANASVMGGGGTAVGQNTKTVGTHSLAVGSHAQTFGVNSISIGASASVGSEGSDTTGGISVGTYASVTGQHGIAIGSNSNTNGPAAVSIGHMSNAVDSNAIAIGTGSTVDSKEGDFVGEGIAIGSQAHTSGFHGVALGASAKSKGEFSVALGEVSIAEGKDSTALGAYSYASGLDSIAVGYSSQAIGKGALASGSLSEASGSYSIATGYSSKALEFESIAIGRNSSATASWSTALGSNSTASGQQSTALGSYSIVSGKFSAALGGYEISVDGVQSVAVGGATTKVTGNYSTALGSKSNIADANFATALGYNSKAAHENSVALGSNSETAAAVGTGYFTLKQHEDKDITFGEFAGSNPLATVSVGKEGQYRTITNVAAGRISRDSTDAINGSQLFAVADGLQNQINDINKKIDNSGDDHYHTVNGNDKEDKTDISNNTDITNNNQDNDVIEKADDINTPASGNSGGTNTDPVGDKPALGGDYVGGEDGNLLIKHDTDSNGNKYYDISLNQDLNINSMNVKNEITVGDNITINSNEIKVGDKVTINDNSVNVGDVTINEDNIDMGGNKIINVAEGTEGTDAVNVNQLKKLEQNVNNKINRLDGKIDKVGAGAAALAALHPLDFDPDDKLNFSAGVGNYHGSTAAAIGAFYQPNDDTLFSIGGTVGNGDEMVNVGVSFRFGQHSNQSRSKKAMAKEIIELRTEIAELKAMMYSLTGQGFDPYKSKIFPDTPENHWAYDYVAVVAGNGILEGYPNGRFDGSRAMTRYEMAAVIYRLMTKGIQVDERMLKEFAPELARVKVDTLTHHEDGTPSIQRVRIIEGRG